MKKKLKLKQQVKDILFIGLFLLVFALILVYGVERITKINNGEIVVISETQMAERN